MIAADLPRIDLHRHLDGSLRLTTILDLARQHDIALPATDLDGLRPFVQVVGPQPDLEHGQRTDTVLGSILRLDVDGGDPYAIPAGNPFARSGGAPEIWVYGMRNPWRFSIDPVDRLVYIGDVGQEAWEEIDVISLDHAGANLGWRLMEGSHCFAAGCDTSGLVLPVVEYGHDEGCSVTAGHVYRGDAIPELRGHFFYADWCRGWVRSFRYSGGGATDQTDWSADLAGIGQIDGFGIGPDGELYAATWGGDLVRIVAVR